MQIRLFLIFISLLFFSSCVKKSFVSSNVTTSEIKDMAVFEPISYINLINKGDHATYNDSLSRISQQLWLHTVELNKYRLPIDNFIVLDDNYYRRQVQDETRLLFEEIEAMDKFYSIPIPPTLKSQLELSGNRFGMLTLTSGFTRRKGNLTGQMIKSIGISILTLGMVIIIPDIAQSYVSVLILDNDLDEVIYYKASVAPDYQPLKERTLHMQLDFLYKNYFW